MSDQTTPLPPLTTYGTGPAGHDERPRRTLRVGYLVMGLIFLGIAGIWALNASGTVGWDDSKYAFPAVLVGAGVLGLVGTVAINATRRTRDPRAAAPDDAPRDLADDTTHDTPGDTTGDTTDTTDTTVLTTDDETDR
jgi:hypothetical protein